MSSRRFRGSGSGWKPLPGDRRRNKERVEASLAGLCELEVRKQRQERRVRSALSPGGAAWTGTGIGTGTEDQSTPLGLSISLEQQVAKLKVNMEPRSADSSDLEHIQLSSGEALLTDHSGPIELNHLCVNSNSLSAQEGNRETELRGTLLSEPTRETMVTDAVGIRKIRVIRSQQDYQAQEAEIYIFELMQRRALSTRLPKPHSSLSPDLRPAGVVSCLSYRDEHQTNEVSLSETSTTLQYSEGTNQAGLRPDHDPYLICGFPEEPPPPFNHQLQLSVPRQRGLYRTPRLSSMVNASHTLSFENPSCSDKPAPPDSSTTEPESHQHCQEYSSSPDSTKPQKVFLPEEQLVSAEYIPAQPYRASAWSYAHHHHSKPYKDSGANKFNQDNGSPERSYHGLHQQPTAPQNQPRDRRGPKKCRPNEDRCGSNKKPGKKANRSQSDNTQRRVSEHKYKSAEREGEGSGSGGKESRRSHSKRKKQQPGGGSSKCRQSTLELSQDEADLTPTEAATQRINASNPRGYCLRRTLKPRPPHGSYVQPRHNPHHHPHHPQQLEHQPESPEKNPEPGQGESESSMSDEHSPHSSSLSSNSEGSCSLVWPQQVPPQLPLPSASILPEAPLQPKAFVKIKASHALKKKILRFRNGSLKVMTTV